METKPKSPSGATSVAKALDVLMCFSPEQPELGVSQISRRLGLGVSTVHRLLATLMSRGFVRQNPETQKYSLGYRVVHLASTVLAGADFRILCLPHMLALREQTGETVRAYSMVGRERICVEELPSPHEIRASGALGRAAPLFAGAPSKVLLAHLPEYDVEQILVEARHARALGLEAEQELRRELVAIRKRGYATSVEENDELAASLAAPVQNFTGAAIGALAITGPAGRWTLERMRAAAPRLVERAAAVSRQLGYVGEPSRQWRVLAGQGSGVRDS